MSSNGRAGISSPSARAAVSPPAKQPAHILGGILALDSDWKPAFGDPLTAALGENPDGRLDFSCAALHGTFSSAADGAITTMTNGKAATAFLLDPIARPQEIATVPMMDTRAYAQWLAP